MPFAKRFPKTIEGQSYPKWIEISLSYEEELEAEQQARKENIQLYKECIKDAKEIITNTGAKPEDENVLHVASSLFEKRASHTIFYKEQKAKDKFDATNNHSASTL